MYDNPAPRSVLEDAVCLSVQEMGRYLIAYAPLPVLVALQEMMSRHVSDLAEERQRKDRHAQMQYAQEHAVAEGMRGGKVQGPESGGSVAPRAQAVLSDHAAVVAQQIAEMSKKVSAEQHAKAQRKLQEEAVSLLPPDWFSQQRQAKQAENLASVFWPETSGNPKCTTS